MYRDPYVYYQSQHPLLKSNQHPQLDDRFQKSAACGFLDRKECKKADAIWKEIMEKGEEDRRMFVEKVDKIIEKASSRHELGEKLITTLQKRGTWQSYADLLVKLKKTYLLRTFKDQKGYKMGLYQWWDKDKKKAMFDYYGWLDRVIHYSIDPDGKFAGERGPVPTLKDIASANTVGHV